MKSTGLFKYPGALAALWHIAGYVSLRYAYEPILDVIECDALPAPADLR